MLFHSTQTVFFFSFYYVLMCYSCTICVICVIFDPIEQNLFAIKTTNSHVVYIEFINPASFT